MLRSRFKKGMDPLALEFSSSMDQDRYIFYYDILVDLAHVLGLLKCGHISEEDAREIIRALLEIRERGYEAIAKEYEDVHEAIEAEVTKITQAGKKMHTARSRNDEVATCLRMFARDRLLSIASAILDLRRVLIRRAKENIDVLMPGFTHLQYAQPTRLSHHLLAYHDMLKRDFDRAIEAFNRVNLSPLGSCAFAGTSFKLDRNYTAELLGFDGVVENSCDAVASRDFLIESIFVATQLMLTLSRMAEEIVLWCSEFDFIDLPEEFASTSSIMPQKKNPDIAELIRAKSGRLIGALTGAMSIYKAMPLTYNRDFQEMNEMLFKSLEIADLSTVLMAKMFEGITFKKDVMIEKVLKNFTIASEIADRLTKAGIPFRDAHRIVGKAVSEGDLGRVVDIAKEMGYDVEVDLNVSVEEVVEGRKNLGGTSKSEVLRMIEDRIEQLERDCELLNGKIEAVTLRLEKLYEEVEKILNRNR
ncbi:argininosuccinate lyase [Archaeoglobus sp.]